MESRSFRRYGYYGAQGLSPKRILLYYDRGLSPRQGGNDRGLEKKKSRKETMNVSLFFLFINLILLRKINWTTNKHGTILIQTYPYRNITDHQNYPRKRKNTRMRRTTTQNSAHDGRASYQPAVGVTTRRGSVVFLGRVTFIRTAGIRTIYSLQVVVNIIILCTIYYYYGL